MSRFIESEVARISKKSGYDELFILDILKEMAEDEEMSRTNRFIKDEISRISEESGYDEEFLMGVLTEMQEDNETDLDLFENLHHLEGVAMEHDF